MKKLISGLMAVAVVSSSAATVVACGNTKYVAYNEIYLVTDAGKIKDKSFNESGYNGGNKAMEYLGVNTDSKYDGIGYFQPPTLNEIPEGYQNAKDAGAKTLILPGFHHAGAHLKTASALMAENSGNTILLDGSPTDDTGKVIENSVGFLFRADISAFYSGMASIIWSITNNNFKESSVKLATFGGSNNGLAVDSFMHGYLASIDAYNALQATDEGKVELKKLFTAAGVEDADLNKKVEIKASRVDSQNRETIISSDFFTGSFDSGAGKDISQKLVDGETANVVMGVAGPQTEDLLGVIKNSKVNSGAMVVGVDTDQVNSYESSSDKFITSAEKDLVSATIAGVAMTTFWDNPNFRTKAEDDIKKAVLTEDQKKLDDWKGQEIYMGGKFSKGGNNKVTEELHTSIMDVFKEKDVLASSTAYFELIAEGSNANDFTKTLATEAIKSYADKIIKAMNLGKSE